MAEGSGKWEANGGGRFRFRQFPAKTRVRIQLEKGSRQDEGSNLIGI